MASPDMSRLLESVQDAPEASFDPEAVLIRQGVELGRIYILVEGEVQLVKGDVQVCRISSPGSVFGEMSALLGVKPTASVIALQPSRFKVIEEPEGFLSEHPRAAVRIARLLAHRVWWLTDRYAAEIDDDDSLYWRWH